jgi:hypothetical protein
MGLIRKVASTMMLGGVSSHTRREPPGKAERARAKAERAREKAAQAQAVRAEAEAKVAEEQAAVLARALHEDEAHRQADLKEVAEKEAEAMPEEPPGPLQRHGCSDARLGLHAPGGNRVGQCRVVAFGLVGVGLGEVGHGLVELA